MSQTDKRKWLEHTLCVEEKKIFSWFAAVLLFFDKKTRTDNAFYSFKKIQILGQMGILSSQWLNGENTVVIFRVCLKFKWAWYKTNLKAFYLQYIGGKIHWLKFHNSDCKLHFLWPFIFNVWQHTSAFITFRQLCKTQPFRIFQSSSTFSPRARLTINQRSGKGMK